MKRAPQYVRAHISNIEEMLEALLDVSNDSKCSIEPEHKAAVKSYLTAYVTPHLRILGDWSRGESVPDWWKR